VPPDRPRAQRRLVIVFETLFGGAWEGGGRYLENLLHALGLLESPPRCLIWGATQDDLPPGLRAAAHVEARPRPSVGTGRSLGARLYRRLARVPYEDPGVEALARAEAPDLWVGLCGFAGLGARRPLLVWYPDFQHRHLPALFSPGERAERETQWVFLLRRAQAIVVTSASVARDALETPEIRDRLHVCAFPPHFSPETLTPSPDEVRRRYHLPGSYFLVCNQLWQHKNHMLVLRALQALRSSGKTPPVVAFTGRLQDYREPNVLQELLDYAHAHGLNDSCRFLGLVPRPDQVALIRGAEAVIQPSRFEGLGAIADEAAVLGVPLLCSDIPVHRERPLPGAILFGPDDVDQLSALLQRSYPRARTALAEIAAGLDRDARAYADCFMNACQAALGHPSAPPTTADGGSPRKDATPGPRDGSPPRA
jgi:glycosyltransferase involved in cell wall biosynthesis